MQARFSSFLVLMLLFPVLAIGQGVPEIKVSVQLDKFAWYYDNTGDPKTYGTVTESQASLLAGTMTPLMRNTILADVVSINDKPARGTFLSDGFRLGGTISGFPRSVVHYFVLDIRTPQDTQIGSLFGTLLGSGNAAPGAPAGAGLWAVYGGSGAYFGVRGQGTNVASSGFHQTTFRESPAARPANSSGQMKLDFYLSGITPFEIQTAYHAADGSPVTNAKPAQPGETLILEVKAAWSTRPPLEPGKVFAEEPLAALAFPVEATAGDQPAEVINAVGWPGTRDRYRVDVRLPAVRAPETALHLVAGYFMASLPYKIPVR